MTYEEILKRMMEKIPDYLDKREGSIIFNAIAPAAAELSQMYIEQEDIMDRTFADTAVGDDLSRRAAERGINRKEATYAVRKGVFNLNVPVGSRFCIEDTTYVVSENMDNFESRLNCEQPGIVGNSYTGELIPLSVVNGLTKAVLTDILIPGEDTEDDESLRVRYFSNLESSAFGGNKADYKEKTKELNGVGGVKVYPVWNGGGTVKLVIIDSTFNKPSDELVDSVQTAVDPVVNEGQGLGTAPIGHIVTVEAVSQRIINIKSNITLAAGYVWADVSEYIKKAVNSYFLNLKEAWENEDGLVVRISQIESSILQITGVMDVQDTELNESLKNLVLSDVEIPVLGTVTQI